jgi:hypothetical protein
LQIRHGGTVQPLQLSGYAVAGPSSGEPGGWFAREAASGALVVLHELTAPDDTSARDRMRRVAARICAVEHAHLLGLRRMVASGAALVLVHDHVDGPGLDDVLRERETLAAGEVVTVLVPVAEAIAAAHRRGVGHGGVDAAAVRFDGTGRPLLAGLGVAALETLSATASRDGEAREAGAETSGPQPQDDVAALGRLGLAMLGEVAGPGRTATAAVAAVLARSTSPHPQGRPTATELAAALFAACPARPVRFGGQPRGRHAAGRRGTAPAACSPPLEQAPVERPGPPTPADRRTRPTPTEGSGRGSPPDRAGRGSPAQRPGRAARADRPIPPGRPRRARARARRLTGGLLVLTGLLVAVMSGLAWASADDRVRPVRVAAPRPSAGPTVQTAPSPTTGRTASRRSEPSSRGEPSGDRTAPGSGSRWLRVLSRLDRARAQSYDGAEPARTAAFDAEGSPAARGDRQQLARLRRAGLRTKDLVLALRRVERVRPTAPGELSDPTQRTVTLRVRDRLQPYALVDSSGAVVRRSPGRAARTWTVQLVLSDRGWRIYDVAP